MNKKHQVLICDDMPEIRELILAVIRDLGFTADAVETGFDAITLAGRNDYRLILLDDKLDDMSGKEVCQAIRELPSLSSRAYIILYTGFPTRDDADIAPGEDGFDLHMVKPQSVSKMKTIVQVAMHFSASEG